MRTNPPTAMRSMFAILLLFQRATAEYSCPTATPAGVKLADCEKLHCPHVLGGEYRFVGGKQVLRRRLRAQ